MPTLITEAVSASRVRKALADGHFLEAASMCPESTWPYLMAALAQRALQQELDTPGKPGLVGPDGPGAHKDMDYSTMMRGIRALRPYWSRMATAASAEELRMLGIEAEKAMMAATGGVNTHRGAIFCLGIAVAAWTQCAYNEKVMQLTMGSVARGLYANSQRISNLPPRGAMAIALSGYKELFEDWLPYYRNTFSPVIVLLRIMSTLDDTCVVKRVGEERAARVKEEAKAALKEIPGQARDEETILRLCEQYAREGISPGGAADMLALTIFIDSIL